MKAIILSLFFITPVFGQLSTEELTEPEMLIVLPSIYEGQPVIVKSSAEWDLLISENKEFARLAREGSEELAKYKKDIDNYLADQENIRNEMILEINKLRIEAGEKDALLWKRLFIILGMSTFMVLYFVAKFYFRIPFI